MSQASLDHPPPRHRHPGPTLYRYIGREALRPALFALIGLTVVVLTTQLLRYSELVINRGVAGSEVALMLFYESVPVAGRMLPFATLVGALVALGRMGADREILALETSGVAAARLVWPVVSFGGVMTILALLSSVYSTPWANRRFDDELASISHTRPWASLNAGAVNEFGGWQLEARQVSPSGRELESVLLWVPEIGETIFARSGSLAARPDGSMEITLKDGSLVKPGADRLRWLRFDSATTVLPDSDASLVRRDKDRIPGLPLSELRERAAHWVPTEDDTLPRAALALQRRFAYPAATLLFAFLAVPLFVARGHYSRANGGVVGVVCTIAYYSLMQFSDGLVQAGSIGPALGAWLPNLLIAALATGLLVRALRERALGKSFEGGARRWLARRQAASEPVRRSPQRHALPRYVGGRFLQLVALSFAVLFVAYFLIDVMDRLEWFTEHGATPVEVLRFYGARIWLLASRAVPLAVLVGTSLTVSLLGVEGELLGMRACGIPAPRALLPVVVLATVMAPLYLLLNNVVVPRTNALADELKRTEIKDDVYRRIRERGGARLWYRAGDQLVEARDFDSEMGQAQDLTIFKLGEDGLPTSRIDAPRGRHIGQGWWRLTDPTRVEIADGQIQSVPAPAHVHLGEVLDARIDTMHMSVRQIAEEARQVESDGFDATPFWVDYYARIADPASLVVLPCVVLLFAVGGPPFPGPAQTLLLSGVIGVAYILLVAVSSSIGRGGVIPPAAAAWSPIGAMALLAGWFGVRVWRQGR